MSKETQFSRQDKAFVEVEFEGIINIINQASGQALHVHVSLMKHVLASQ